MGKGIELFFNLLLALVFAFFFGGNLYLWLYPLKGHPLRNKVLRNFFIFLFFVITLICLWYMVKRMDDAKRLPESLVLLFYLALLLAGWVGFHIYVLSYYSSLFIYPLTIYMRYFTKGIRLTKSELRAKVDETLKSILEFQATKMGRAFRIASLIAFWVFIAIFLSLLSTFYQLIHPIFSKPSIYSARVSEDDEFLAIELLSHQSGGDKLKDEFIILSIPSKQVISRLPLQDENNNLLGWFKGTLLATINEENPNTLLIWKKENGSFHLYNQTLPRERYQYLSLRGDPPTLYATLKGSSQVVKLEEKDHKFLEEATFSFPHPKGVDKSFREYLWSLEGEPLLVILKTDGDSIYSVGLMTPDGKTKWLSYLERKEEGTRWRWNFFDGGNRFYLLFQREKVEPWQLLPHFIVLEISSGKANIKEIVWEGGESDYIYQVIATKNGFVVIYPLFSPLDKGKRYIFIISPNGDRSVLTFKGKGFTSATPLNKGNKFLLFAPGQAFLLDVDKGELAKFMSFKKLFRSHRKNASS